MSITESNTQNMTPEKQTATFPMITKINLCGAVSLDSLSRSTHSIHLQKQLLESHIKHLNTAKNNSMKTYLKNQTLLFLFKEQIMFF